MKSEVSEWVGKAEFEKQVPTYIYTKPLNKPYMKAYMWVGGNYLEWMMQGLRYIT